MNPVATRFHKQAVAATNIRGVKCLSAAGLILLIAGCSVVEIPARLEALEREQSALGDRVVGLDESVSNLTTRYTALDIEMSTISERLDKVDAWIRRLGGRGNSSTLLPSAGHVNAASQRSIASRHLVRAGDETVIFDNGTTQRVLVRARPGPGFSPDAQIEMRVVSLSDTSSLGGLTSSGRYNVPCGSRLVASTSADLLLFVETENAGPC